MACFVVPMVQAVVTTAVAKAVKSKEKKIELNLNTKTAETSHKLPFSRKLKWLSNLLWGGSVLLAFEHIWHGEVVPFAPFIAAMGDKADTMEMVREMATVGVTMAGLVTAVWVGMLIVTRIMEKKPSAHGTANTEA